MRFNPRKFVDVLTIAGVVVMAALVLMQPIHAAISYSNTRTGYGGAEAVGVSTFVAQLNIGAATVMVVMIHCQQAVVGFQDQTLADVWTQVLSRSGAGWFDYEYTAPVVAGTPSTPQIVITLAATANQCYYLYHAFSTDAITPAASGVQTSAITCSNFGSVVVCSPYPLTLTVGLTAPASALFVYGLFINEPYGSGIPGSGQCATYGGSFCSNSDFGTGLGAYLPTSTMALAGTSFAPGSTASTQTPGGCWGLYYAYYACQSMVAYQYTTAPAAPFSVTANIGAQSSTVGTYAGALMGVALTNVGNVVTTTNTVTNGATSTFTIVFGGTTTVTQTIAGNTYTFIYGGSTTTFTGTVGQVTTITQASTTITTTLGGGGGGYSLLDPVTQLWVSVIGVNPPLAWLLTGIILISLVAAVVIIRESVVD